MTVRTSTSDTKTLAIDITNSPINCSGTKRKPVVSIVVPSAPINLMNRTRQSTRVHPVYLENFLPFRWIVRCWRAKRANHATTIVYNHSPRSQIFSFFFFYPLLSPLHRRRSSSFYFRFSSCLRNVRPWIDSLDSWDSWRVTRTCKAFLMKLLLPLSEPC